jgi:hypothetical protein
MKSKFCDIYRQGFNIHVIIEQILGFLSQFSRLLITNILQFLWKTVKPHHDRFLTGWIH